LIAVFLVAFVMLFFLHSIRNSLIVMVSIPALISTFIGFYYLGYTLNLMSLLGLSVVGILVDDAIVVLEYLQAHGNGKNRVRAAYDGTAEIGGTVLRLP
jgi:HAE1 family hydrophobic/amphiphilic exporter-1